MSVEQGKDRADSGRWLHIVLQCEGCQIHAIPVTLAVSGEEVLYRAICPRCGAKFQDIFTFDRLRTMEENSLSMLFVATHRAIPINASKV